MFVKADSADFLGRFREIVSDPLNLLIERHHLAGIIEGEFVYLHNGNKVQLQGPYAYYGDFSNILVINRGVHEPLEEYVFQELLKVIPSKVTMLELGAYWGHYSMWLKKRKAKAVVHLVEPDEANIQAGQYNFQQNGFQGKFVKAFVGKGNFEVDNYLREEGISTLDILHTDIQGYEVEMLDGCVRSLQNHKINYVFISTHSQELHLTVVEYLRRFGYRVEVSADVDRETTSFDGFVFASSPLVESVFGEFTLLGLEDILKSSPDCLLAYINEKLTKEISGRGWSNFIRKICRTLMSTRK